MYINPLRAGIAKRKHLIYNFLLFIYFLLLLYYLYYNYLYYLLFNIVVMKENSSDLPDIFSVIICSPM